MPTAPDGTVRPAFDLVAAGPVVNAGDDVTDANGCDVTHCSLREAIASATPGATITFAESATGTITLTSTLQINKNLTITGPGAAQLTVSGDNAHRVFTFGAGVTASLSGLTIADGSAANGGGIYKTIGTLTITDCVISGNQATGSGGGIYNATGTLIITDCVVSGNQAGGAGGIVSYGGGAVWITESTISGNTAATGNGGGMYAYLTTLTLERSTLSGNTAAAGNGGGARFQLGSTTILNSTISGNTASSAGGIYRFQGTTRIILSTITDNNATAGSGGVDVYHAGTHMDVKGSIIWGNTRSGTTAADVGGSAAAYSSMGYNLIGAGSGTPSFDEATDQTGVTDALLGTLQLNGPGTTKTHALLAGSPAIDAGTCTDHADVPVLTDQRGVTRPQPSGGPCDIGAYELRGGNLALLMEDVVALGPDGTGTLNQGQANSLLVTLDVVLKKLENGQSHVALNNLWAFIDKVETFTADGVLTTVEGQPLIDLAEQIIGAIEAM
jgi:hypothetical protein